MFDKISRRFFLKGAGGFTLSIPFLPSLLEAQNAGNTKPNLVVFHWMHGGVNVDVDTGQYFPRPETISWQNHVVRPGYTIRSGNLPTSLSQGQKLSEVFDSGFNPYFRKMNLLRGLDILQGIEHNEHNFGSITRPDHPGPHVATIDQVIARYPGFYPTGFSGVRSVHYSPLKNHSRPSATIGPDGRRQSMDFEVNPSTAFNALFGNGVPNPNPSNSVVDLVIGDYRSLRNNTRLSVVDKGRLDEHIALLDDLQRSIKQLPNCTSPTAPPNVSNLNPAASFSDGIQHASVMNDVLVAGLRCGLTKVGVLCVNGIYPNLSGDLHQGLWHRWHMGLPDVDAALHDCVNWYFRAVLLDLVRKMDGIVEANGKTLLDNSLVLVHQENQVPHDDRGKAFITFGSANDRFVTGKYIDYRNQQSQLAHDARVGHAVFAGIPIQPFFNSILQGFGVPREYYERPRDGIYKYGGYGAIYHTGFWKHQSTVLKDKAGRSYVLRGPVQLFDEYWLGEGIISLVDQKLPLFSLT